MLTEATTANINLSTTVRSNTEKTLIVLSAPSVHDEYYTSKLTIIIDYMINFAKIVNGKDDVVILVDDDTLKYFKGKVPSNILIKSVIADVWIRDFSAVIPARQVKFKYLPNYQPAFDAESIDQSFKSWFLKHGFNFYKTSDIILDGGNVVDNAAGTRVIITDRILQDNPSLTKASAKKTLKKLLNVNEVAIIKSIPNDTTGHADGMVMWATNDRILVTEMKEPIQSEVINELKSSFLNVEVVKIPNYFVHGVWEGFISACNVYVNSVVTDDYIYMPTFNSSRDIEMLNLFQSLTNKKVVSIPAQSVCMMGGSVRCLSTQIKGQFKTKILEAAVSSSSSINIPLCSIFSFVFFFIGYILH